MKLNLSPLAFLIISLLVAGCASSKLYKYESIDLSDKSITVPPGGGSIMAEIKMRLKNEGWDVIVRRGPDVTDKAGEREETYSTYKTRYALTYEEEILRNGYGDRFTDHGISVIDNTTNKEVFFIKSISGSASYIARRFMDALNGREPANENADNSDRRPRKR